MRRKSFLFTLCAGAILAFTTAWARSDSGGTKTLQIFCVDVEGGQATLLVDPLGESVLVDTGWPGFDSRDAKRIVAAAHEAGIHRIDYVVITHYHADHVGGVAQLAALIPIGAFVDHGPNMEDAASTNTGYAAYISVSANAKRITVKPGDHLPLKGMSVEFIAAAGERITAPLPDAGQPNPYCAGEPEAAADPTENQRSLAMLVTYGKFRFADFGDLTKRKEIALVCPNNLIGTVDLFLVSHHGSDLSNSKPIVDVLHPRAAIMDNGAHKGGTAEVWQTVHDSPGLKDLWQLHYAVSGGAEHNSPEQFIANMDEANDAGYAIKALARHDGTFVVINERNHFEKSYQK